MENFFLRMHLKTYIPFFKNFENDIMQKLLSKLDTHHYKKGDVIERKGDESDLMQIVVLGKVGIYFDSDLVVCAYEVTDNGDFGMRLM
jgi:signal-transduction protein with cAMP-binding, CBS, and nucleotidyltransferase domain